MNLTNRYLMPMRLKRSQAPVNSTSNDTNQLLSRNEKHPFFRVHILFRRLLINPMCSKLEETWNEITSDFPQEVKDNWWNQIMKKYSEEHRYFHNYKNIEEKIEHFNNVKSVVKDPKAVALALLFHYFEYDPKVADNEEKNILFFNNFANEAGIPNDSKLHVEVVDLLKAAATHSTEAHKTNDLYGNDDCHFFLDIDMAVLGSSPEDYAHYTELVQKEYEFLPEKTYKALRCKVLQSFLMIPNIYATKHFREKFEKQARENVQKEVSMLKP